MAPKMNEKCSAVSADGPDEFGEESVEATPTHENDHHDDDDDHSYNEGDNTLPHHSSRDPDNEDHCPPPLDLEAEPPFLRAILASSDQITAMLSNFSTNYNVVNIGLVLPILQSPTLYQRDVSEGTDSLCASSCLAGMVVGQLVGGALGDLIGRMNAMYIVIALQIVASLSSALLVWDGVGIIDEWTVFDQLAAWRFILGIGAGGVYPLAAVMSAEQNLEDDGARGGDGGGTYRRTDSMQMRHDQRMEDRKLKMIAITFSMQGVGFLTVPLVTYPLLLVLGEPNLDKAWRIILGLGALPGLVLLFLRWRSHRKSRLRDRDEPVPLCPPESVDPVLSLSVDADGSESGVHNGGHLQIGGIEANENEEPLMSGHEAVHDEELNDGRSHDALERPQEGLLSSIKHEKQLVRKLLGTAGTWMLFDILFYGNTLFQPIVLEAAFGGGSSSKGNEKEDAFELLMKAGRDSLLLSVIALPGYFVSTFLMGRRTCYVVHQTPRFIQIQGLACMAVFYAIVGAYWTDLTSIQWLLLLLYGGTFFFANYGPNTTTFMLPSITFSPSCRSSLNGISAASGKAGALLGATLFEPLADDWGDDRVMLLCAGVSLLALFLTWACVAPGKKPGGLAAGDHQGEMEDVLLDETERIRNTSRT